MALVITMKKKYYFKKGRKWIEDVTRNSVPKVITQEHLNNIIESAPFFRKMGSSQRIVRNYTVGGYVPVEVHSISPSKQEKQVYLFDWIER